MISIRRYVLLLLLFVFDNQAKAGLYPGETIMKGGGAESLVFFKKGDPDKPLIVFVPGDSHLARISYGFPHGKEKDFLAYWLNKKGYSFLGISYPLENPVYTQVYPGFSIHDWGEQIAEISQQIIEKHKLSNKIVILGWSMGGSIEETATSAAVKHGLEVQLFIGLSAVPPLPYVMQSGPYSTGTMRANHLADRSKLFPIFYQLIEQQNQLNQHKIIPETVYTSEFIGHIPAALAAEGYMYQNRHLVKNIPSTLKDGQVFDFANTPWIALIVDDSMTTAKISLIDPAAWNFLRAEMIYSQYLKGKLSGASSHKWHKISELLNSLPQLLTMTVNGNHFFFLGEKGARKTAEQINELLGRVDSLKEKLHKLLQ
ncbi:hypothetical protein B1207_10890 [Legionella quinlivanii]|uniref:Alpha/beta hydrolase family protein n=1 Tax=Legionella quinlivanii TaxID=45073 RepID=A0A364LID7_9GAMM|nr:hypothetical protein [Legionella quinlivanii]RAP36068.1 hypothetical protein B1207_10890 [Legionella quinlivanii]